MTEVEAAAGLVPSLLFLSQRSLLCSQYPLSEKASATAIFFWDRLGISNIGSFSFLITWRIRTIVSFVFAITFARVCSNTPKRARTGLLAEEICDKQKAKRSKLLLESNQTCISQQMRTFESFRRGTAFPFKSTKPGACPPTTHNSDSQT